MPTTVLTGLRAVVFDVGETLVDETRSWSEQARLAGLTPFTLMAALGAQIAAGADHRLAWDALGVARPTTSPTITASDLYPDALDCLRAAHDAGLTVGIAGNQPRGAEHQLRTAGVDVDLIASSAAWGVAKPAAEFFDRVVAAAGVDPRELLYVGDRLDNDVLPARAAGMRTALIRRGPWGHRHATMPDAALADLRIDGLAELTAVWRTHRRP